MLLTAAVGIMMLSATSATQLRGAPANTLTWVGMFGNDWGNPLNWDLIMVPTASDAVVINSGSVLLPPEGGFAVMNLNGGNLTATNAISGTVNWAGGTIDGVSRLTLVSGATLNIIGTADQTLSCILTNAGTVRWSGTGNLLLEGGVIINLAGGTFDIQNDRAITYSFTPGAINNVGLLRKTAGVGTNSIGGGVGFTNSGTIQAQTGAVSFGSGGRYFASGSVFSGAGRCLFLAGTITMNGTITSQNAEIAGATLTGTNTLTGTLGWSAGVIDVAAKMTITSNSLLNISGAADKSLYGTLTNAGTIQWTGGGSLNLEAGKLYNLAGSTFDIQNDRNLTYISSGGLFYNAGLLRKSAGTGTNGFSTGLAFTNSGTVEVKTGAVNFGSGYRFILGTVFTGAGYSRFPSGTITFNGTIISENVELAGATLYGTNTLSGRLNWSGGAIDATARVTIPSNSVLNISGAADKSLYGMLTNAGTVLWSGGGNLNLEAGTFLNLAGGIFDIQNDRTLGYITTRGTLLNAGLLRKSAGIGTNIFINGMNFTNTGTVEVQAGVLSFGNLSTFNPGTAFTGAGLSVFTSGTVTMNGVITSQNTELAGATLAGTNTLNGTVNWSSGYIGGTAKVAISAAGVLNLSGATDKTVRGVLTNAGRLVMTGAGNFVLDAGAFYNLAGSTFEMQNDRNIAYGATVGTFNNQGLLCKTAGSSTNSITTGVTFVNSGTVEVRTGVVSFGTGATFANGTYFKGTGASVLNRGTVMLNGMIASDNLELAAGGTLNGTNTISGTMNWSGGTIDTAAKMCLPTNSVMNISGTSDKTIRGALTNSGTVRWTGTGNLLMDGGSLQTLADGTVDVQNDRAITYTSAPGTVNNAGLFRKSGGIGTNAVTAGVIFVNSGTVDVQTGTVSFGNGCTFNSGTVFIGSGRSLFAVGTVTFNGAILSQNAVLAGSTLAGTNTFSGTFSWTGGNMNAPARVAIAADGVLNVSGPGDKSLYGILTNAGTVYWAGTSNANFVLCGVPIYNLAGGVFELQSDRPINSGGCGSGTFHNSGLLRKSAGLGTTFTSVAVTNQGQIEVRSGNIRFAGGFVQNGGETFLNGGSLSASTTLNFHGGLLKGSGTITGSVFSAAQVSPGASSGTLTIHGNYTQTAAGALNVEIGGLTPGSQFDRLVVTNAATLDGALNVSIINGFKPTGSNSFTVMTYASRTGYFSGTNGLSGVGVQPVYNTNNLTLTVSDRRPYIVSPVYLGNGQFQFQLTSLPGARYVVQVSTDLETWTPMTTLSCPCGDVMVTDPEAKNFPRRFYRAVEQ